MPGGTGWYPSSYDPTKPYITTETRVGTYYRKNYCDNQGAVKRTKALREQHPFSLKDTMEDEYDLLHEIAIEK